MSIWSRCYGTFKTSKNSGFSLKKFIESHYDEFVMNEYSQVDDDAHNCVTVKFDFSFSLDGMAAAELIQLIVDKISSTPGYVYSQIESEIRFS